MISENSFLVEAPALVMDKAAFINYRVHVNINYKNAITFSKWVIQGKIQICPVLNKIPKYLQYEYLLLINDLVLAIQKYLQITLLENLELFRKYGLGWEEWIGEGSQLNLPLAIS